MFSRYKEKIREGIGKEQEKTTGDKSFSMHAKNSSREEDRHAGKTTREGGRVEEDSRRKPEEKETTGKEKEEDREKMDGEDEYMNETIRACRQAIAAGVDTSLQSAKKTLLEGSSKKESGGETEDTDRKEEEKNEVEDLSRENNLIIQTLLDAKGIQVGFQEKLTQPK